MSTVIELMYELAVDTRQVFSICSVIVLASNNCVFKEELFDT
jgi:hypothetical protein